MCCATCDTATRWWPPPWNGWATDRPTVDPDLAADFLALGFCHFQVELLTRKLRYMSNLDEASLQTAALAAADEALKGDPTASRRHLQTAFDRLHDAREYFYPSEARLLDLTLVAESTLGAPLRAELTDSISGGADIPVCPEIWPGGQTECLPHPGMPRNLLVSGEMIEAMAQREPATLETLKQALAGDKAALVGGEYAESRLPLLGPEAIEVHLRRGLATYEKHLGRRPTVFGRRRFGLTPALPQLLDRAGFTGVLHCTLDDGRFPTGNQSRVQWEGIDGTTIEAIGCLPLDAGRAESFLRLAETLSNAMNLDQTSTVMFAHWPGRSSPWYDDLRRIAAYGSLFGTFSTITDYFEQTSLAGQQTHYQPDQYRSPYLSQDVAAGRRDPISRWVRYFRRRAVLESAAAMETLAGLCGKGEGEGEGGDEERRTRNEELTIAVEESLCADQHDSATLDDELSDQLHQPLVGFAQSDSRQCAIRRARLPGGQSLELPPAGIPSSFILHPSSFAVDVPAMGFAWVGPGVETPLAVERKGWFGRRKRQEPPPLAEANVLRNEFFEVRFDPQTGAIRTISDYYSRDPRLAQQIALRLPRGGEPGADVNYSIMAADELVVTSAGPVLGEIQSRGRLLDREGRRVAGFQQTTRRVARQPHHRARDRVGHRTATGPQPVGFVLCGPIRLERRGRQRIPQREHGQPADGACAVRIAALCGHPPRQAAHDLAGGRAALPSPVRTAARHAAGGARRDRAVVPVGDRHRRAASDGRGVRVHGAAAWCCRISPGRRRPPVGCSISIAATCWPRIGSRSPHIRVRTDVGTDQSQSPPRSVTAPAAAGFRVRLLETDGRGVRLGLRCFRPVASARKINPGDVPPVELVVEGDRIDIPIGPHQWIEVEGRFASP